MIAKPTYGQLEGNLPLIAQMAGRMLLDRQAEAVALEQNYKDFVTELDIKSEKFIRAELDLSFHGIPVYAEELGGEARRQGPVFIVDPLDGTKNFVQQDDHWSVSLAYVLDGKTKAGAVYLPGKRIAFYADDDPYGESGSQVSSVSLLKHAHVWGDWGKNEAERPLEVLRRLKEKTIYPQIRVCCTASMAAVALGKADAYVHVHPDPFDHAAMSLVVENYGGKVTDFKGNPWHPFMDSLVASNGLIHDELLELLSGIA